MGQAALAENTMSTHDKQSRPWAKLSELKAGDKIEADAGFICIPAKAVLEIKAAPALYVECSGCSRHYIDAQADDGEHLVGFYKA